MTIKDFLYAADLLFEMKDSARLETRFQLCENVMSY